MFLKKDRNLLSVCCKTTDVPLYKRHYFGLETFLFCSTLLKFGGLERDILPDVLLSLRLPVLSDEDVFEDWSSENLPISFFKFFPQLDEREDE